jgi:hypothetical protein
MAAMGNRQEYQRQYYLANREKLKAYARENRLKNLDRERERYRIRRLNGYKPRQQLICDQFKDEFWSKQDGYCYLCGDPLLSKESAHLDHDHRCCPPHYFCNFCVRGLSCMACNHLIGNAGDDPDRLEVIARNLRAKLVETNERLAAKPTQATLDDMESA